MKRPTPTEELGAARVLYLQGRVKVTPSGAGSFPAAVDHDLVRTDLIEPEDGAFAVLGLENGHLVRIDDVGALKVGQILLVDVKTPATRPAAEQLIALLDPAERAGFPVQNVADRAAAWRQMRRAGESAGRNKDSAGGSPTTRAERSAQAPTGGAASEAAGGPGASNMASPRVPSQVAQAAPTPPAEPQKASSSKEGVEESRASEKKRARKDVRGIDDLLDRSDADDDVRPPPRQAAPATVPVTTTPTPTPTPTTEPGVQARFGAKPGTATVVVAPALGGDVRTCLEVSAAEHGVAVGVIELRLEVRGGVITRARFGGALPVTSCSATLVGRTVTLGDGWLVVTAGAAP